MVANDGSILRECFARISELLKRNWPGAARIQFTMGFTWAKNLQKHKIFIFGTGTHLYELI
jgi:hypothetical protein